jgi:pyruvate ferredoxin oxidoreductase gamma subunit
MKTASRVLGTAFFRHGFEVQDAPRHGAERRGAPVFAFVRAARHPIYERGAIHRPGLVVVADDTLVAIPAAGVMLGVDGDSILLIDSAVDPAAWRARLNWNGRIIVLPKPAANVAEHMRYVGGACAGAAARLVGVISRDSLLAAVEEEYRWMGPEVVRRNSEVASVAYEEMREHAGLVTDRPDRNGPEPEPDWIDLPLDQGDVAAPAIRAPLTSVQVRTGLWRSMRPVIDYDRCRRCWWVCSTFCPDNAISVAADGRPEIDYDHCKGCMICVTQCPPHAISAIPEAGDNGSRAAEEARP